MKICFVGPSNSIHIKRFCKYFVSKNYEVHLITFAKESVSDVNMHFIDSEVNPDGSDLQKLKYFLLVSKVKKEIKSINPDIISVHYASSYGLIMSLTGIKNYFLSLWGSDVFAFPKKSPIHKRLFIYSLKRAKKVLSTSSSMKEEALKYLNREILVTPFGINTELFSKKERTMYKDKFTIGIVKRLYKVYGIDLLIKAVIELKDTYPEMQLRLVIAGDGEEKDNLVSLTKGTKMENDILFLGKISEEEVSTLYSNLDLAVYPSLSESYGVSVLEAQACSVPLIVSNAPGLMEVTIENETSLVVNRGSVDEIKAAIYKLYYDNDLRDKLGNNGRKNVTSNFEYDKCFKDIEKIFID